MLSAFFAIFAKCKIKTNFNYYQIEMNKAVILYILLLISFVVPVHQVKCQNPSKELGLKTVVIDPGHGGKDPGCLGKTRKTDEKHIALSIALGFGDRIKAAYPDVKVVYTRSTDVQRNIYFFIIYTCSTITIKCYCI